MLDIEDAPDDARKAAAARDADAAIHARIALMLDEDSELNRTAHAIIAKVKAPTT